MKRIISVALLLCILTQAGTPAFAADSRAFERPDIVFAELRQQEPQTGSGPIFYIEFSLPDSYRDDPEHIKVTPLAQVVGSYESGYQIVGKSYTVSEVISLPVAGKKDVFYIKSDPIDLPFESARKLEYNIKLDVEYYRADNGTQVTIAAESGNYHLYGDDEPWLSASSWTVEELRTASKAGLIPEILKWQDLTQPVTRAEFAAVAVGLYESVSSERAPLPANNPFTDTGDPDVLKAYALGITNGTSRSRFSPDALVSREQVATMLVRTMTLACPGLDVSVSSYSKFADDDKISPWAKESVYFMAKNNIITGIGNNLFAPKNTTAREESENYANATRESAIVISLRCYQYIESQ